MKQAICIGTYGGNILWFENLCRNLIDYRDYPIVVVANTDEDKLIESLTKNIGWEYILRGVDSQELGFIKTMYETDYDQFFYIHDTVEIKSTKLFDIAFRILKDYSVALCKYPAIYGMFMGKYTKRELSQIDIPLPKDKKEGTELEIKWTLKYASVNPNQTVVMFPDLKDRDDEWAVYEEKFGRNNKILENEYIKKYKSKWHRSMI